MFRRFEGDNYCLLLPSPINEGEEEVGEDLGDISSEEEPCSEYGLFKVEGGKKTFVEHSVLGLGEQTSDTAYAKVDGNFVEVEIRVPLAKMVFHCEEEGCGGQFKTLYNLQRHAKKTHDMSTNCERYPKPNVYYKHVIEVECEVSVDDGGNDAENVTEAGKEPDDSLDDLLKSSTDGSEDSLDDLLKSRTDGSDTDLGGGDDWDSSGQVDQVIKPSRVDIPLMNLAAVCKPLEVKMKEIGRAEYREHEESGDPAVSSDTDYDGSSSSIVDVDSDSSFTVDDYSSSNTSSSEDQNTSSSTVDDAEDSSSSSSDHVKFMGVPHEYREKIRELFTGVRANVKNCEKIAKEDPEFADMGQTLVSQTKRNKDHTSQTLASQKIRKMMQGTGARKYLTRGNKLLLKRILSGKDLTLATYMQLAVDDEDFGTVWAERLKFFKGVPKNAAKSITKIYNSL